MSKVIWKKILIPLENDPVEDLNDEIFQMSIERVKKIQTASNAFAIPDPKALRSMSRASVFLSHLVMDAKSCMESILTESPFAVGIYCAVENGPIDAPSTQKIVSGPKEQFAELYRKLRGPKMYLKQLPNLVPAQLGISLGIQGVMNVYTHSKLGSLQALQQAEEDLGNDRVKLALVCSSHAFDDFLVVKRTRQLDSRVIVEGAGALLLQKNEVKTKWNEMNHKNSDEFYGISDQIIRAINI